jgi:hypothetical protein
MSRGPGPHLLAELSSGAATCSSTLDLTFMLRWAPVLPRVPEARLPERRAPVLPCVPQLRTSPPYRGGLWHCYMSHGSGLCLPKRRALVLPRTPRPPSGLWTTGIKKGLAAPGTRLGSHIFKARSRVTEAPTRCADMPLQFGSTVQHQPSWPLLDMTTVVI